MNENQPVRRLAVVQLMRHPGLDASREGALAALVEEGFVPGRNLHVGTADVQGEIPALAPLAQRHRDDGVDLVLAISTPVLLTYMGVFADTAIPIVFNGVTDPFALSRGLITSPTEKPANVTGIQALPPIADLLRAIAAAKPEAHQVGVVWAPAEPSAQLTMRLVREAAESAGMNVVEAAVKGGEGVAGAATDLAAQGIDLFLVLADPVVARAVESLAGVAVERQVPVFSLDPGTGGRGAAVVVAQDFVAQGALSGRLAARILRGESPAGLPIEQVQAGQVSISDADAARQGLAPTPALLALRSRA